MSVQCWPYGHDHRAGDCDQEIPDDSSETMRRFGWGFVWARDDGSSTGDGPFLACPHHRSDLSDEERERALEINARALLTKGETS